MLCSAIKKDTKQCTNPAKYNIDGKIVCGVHAPKDKRTAEFSITSVAGGGAASTDATSTVLVTSPTLTGATSTVVTSPIDPSTFSFTPQKQTLFMMCGFETTTFVKEKNTTVDVVSSEVIDENGIVYKTIDQVKLLVYSCLEDNKSVIVDRANLSKEDRLEFTTIASLRNIEIICVYISNVPANINSRLINKFIEPSEKEGFKLVKF